MYRIDKTVLLLIKATCRFDVNKNCLTLTHSDKCNHRKWEYFSELHQKLKMSSTSLHVLSQPLS